MAVYDCAKKEAKFVTNYNYIRLRSYSTFLFQGFMYNKDKMLELFLGMYYPTIVERIIINISKSAFVASLFYFAIVVPPMQFLPNQLTRCLGVVSEQCSVFVISVAPPTIALLTLFIYFLHQADLSQNKPKSLSSLEKDIIVAISIIVAIASLFTPLFSLYGLLIKLFYILMPCTGNDGNCFPAVITSLSISFLAHIIALFFILKLIYIRVVKK